jgi:hypothetical protein
VETGFPSDIAQKKTASDQFESDFALAGRDLRRFADLPRPGPAANLPSPFPQPEERTR